MPPPIGRKNVSVNGVSITPGNSFNDAAPNRAEEPDNNCEYCLLTFYASMMPPPIGRKNRATLGMPRGGHHGFNDAAPNRAEEPRCARRRAPRRSRFNDAAPNRAEERGPARVGGRRARLASMMPPPIGRKNHIGNPLCRHASTRFNDAAPNRAEERRRISVLFAR